MLELIFMLILAREPKAAVTCEPDEACYLTDPNPPKTTIPPNCVVDEEGGLICNPIDESDKFKT